MLGDKTHVVGEVLYAAVHKGADEGVLVPMYAELVPHHGLVVGVSVHAVHDEDVPDRHRNIESLLDRLLRHL